MTSKQSFQTRTFQRMTVILVLAIANGAVSAQTIRDGSATARQSIRVNPFDSTGPLRVSTFRGEGTNFGCQDDAMCDDGLFCNGSETCTKGFCSPGVPPCAIDGAFCKGAVSCNEDTDTCFDDCNGNNIPDQCDIENETSDDCNNNSVPDECDTDEDCNGNGIPDSCDIASGSANDCNDNSIPDLCDISDETSNDCNSNSIPDECDAGGDCNRNGILDSCDIATGSANDCNSNGIPDVCDIRGRPAVYFVFETGNDTLYRLEDLNGDGDANDEGEGWRYGDIDGVEGIDVDQRNGDVYTAEEGNELIYRYRDLNGDGDALDEGEKFLYADDSEVGEDSIEDIAVDESSNTVYTVYEDEDLIVWHRDNNGDGDALDEGEWGSFATEGYDLESITVDGSTGDVYVGDAEEDDVWRLDRDGEGLGSVGNEMGHEAVDFNDNTGELFAGEEDFDHVNRWVNGEENQYAELLCCSEALAVDPLSGILYVGDFGALDSIAGGSSAHIRKFVDLNGDGDALDENESLRYHDFLFVEMNESEAEALAAFGGGASLDENGDGIPDECVVRGGGVSDSLSGVDSTSDFGTVETTAKDSSDRVLAGIHILQAAPRKQVSWNVTRVEGTLGDPGPGDGTSTGFDGETGFVRTFDTKITSPSQTYNAVVFINLNNVELGGAGLEPADVRLHVLNAGRWEVAGTNDLGDSVPTTTVGDYGFTFRNGEQQFWAVRDDISIFAVGKPVIPEEPQPEQTLPSDDDEDGVNNDLDLCPGTAAGAVVDADGCEIVVNEEPAQSTPDNSGQNVCGAGLTFCGTMGLAAMLGMMFGLVGLKTSTRNLRRRR